MKDVWDAPPDWPALQARFSWLRAMEGVPQNPVYHARTRIVYVEAPCAEILKRNRARQASVPEEVIYRLLDRLEMPGVDEAYRIEWVQNERL